MKHFLNTLVILLCASTVFAAGNPTDSLAKTVLAKADMHATICEMPRVGDGTLAAALAEAGVAQVHAIAPDVMAAELARIPAAKLGLLGSQVIIETGKPDALPLGDWVADLVVIADATDAMLPSVSAAEIARVLSPYRGVAVVGRPAGIHGGLSKAALAEWAKGTGGTAKITEDASGMWAVVTMPPLKGGDDWSHFYHGPDANPLSADATFAGSHYQLQWHGYPIQGARNYTVVAAAGRFFVSTLTLYASGFAGHQHPEIPPSLEARNLYNGKLLWRRAISAQFGDYGSLLIATPDLLYIKDGTDVLALNAETGIEVRRIGVTEVPQQVRWLMLSDGILVTLAGLPPFNPLALAREKGESDSDYDKRSIHMLHEREMCQEASGWDVVTGKRLWQYKDTGIYPRKMVISNGRVFCYVNDSDALCLDLKTGRELWRQSAPSTFQTHARADQYANENRGDMLAIATPKSYVIYDPFRKNYQAFSAVDGHVLWTSDAGKGNILISNPVIFGDTIFGQMAPVNLLTGQAAIDAPYAKNFRYYADSCGHTTAVASGAWLGGGGGVIDLATGKQCGPASLTKSGCATGFFVTDGVEVMYPNVCECNYQWGGMFVTRPTATRPLREGVRLEIGDAAAPTETHLDARDWPTYRADETRKGSSAAVVPAVAGVKWVYTPSLPASKNTPVLPLHLTGDPNTSQAIAVGTQVYFGTSEGAVICLDSATGTERWRYWTAAAVKAPPTWSAGRLYVGSSDGWAYCLNAETGHLCWRYRVAREERRLGLMDGLGSAWPIWSSVLVHDNVAYIAAGLRGQLDGATLCALDAASGTVKWRQDFQNSVTTNDNGDNVYESPSGGGVLTWYGNKLWWHGGQWGPAVVDPASGLVKRALDYPASFTSGLIMSVDMGILPGGWVVFGGNRIVTNYAYWGASSYAYPALLLRTGPDGLPATTNPQTDLPHMLKLTSTGWIDGYGSTLRSRQIPVWDDREALLPGDIDTEHKAPMLCQDIGAWLNAEDDAHPWDANAIRKVKQSWEKMVSMTYLPRVAALATLPANHLHEVLSDDLAAEMKKNQLQFSGIMAMAQNAVILIVSRDMRYFASGAVTNWSVIALNRSDHTKLWEVSLPAAPATTGISMTRAGDVLVPLADGRLIAIGEQATNAAVMEPAAIVPDTQPGLEATDYVCDWLDVNYRSNWSPADFAILKPANTFVLPESRFNDGNKLAQNILRMKGYIEAPTSGSYRFTLLLPPGSCLYFNIYDRTGQRRVSRSMDGWGSSYVGNVWLEAGKHPIDIAISAGEHGRKMALQWEGPGIPRAEIPSTALSHLPAPDIK